MSVVLVFAGACAADALRSSGADQAESEAREPIDEAVVEAAPAPGSDQDEGARPGSPSLGDAERAARVRELVERLAPRLSSATDDLVPERAPDGQLHIDLQRRFQHASVARLQPDGSLRSVCVDSAPALERALSNEPVAPDELGAQGEP